MLIQSRTENSTDTCLRVVEGFLCVSYKGLELAGISKTFAWKSVSQNTWRQCMVGWIAYDSINDYHRKKIDQYYGDVFLAYLRQEYLRRARLEIDTTDSDYFYRQQNYTEQAVSELIEACGWLRLLSNIYRQNKDVFIGRGTVSIERKKAIFKALGLPLSMLDKGGVKEIFLKEIVRILGYRNLYGLRVSNYRVLDGKVKSYLEVGRDALISNYFNNTNHQKLPNWAVVRIYDLYAGGNIKVDFYKITTTINQELLERGVTYRKQNGIVESVSITESRVRQLIVAESLRLDPSRHGEVVSKQKNQTTIRGKDYAGPNQMWSVDGSTIQLFVMHNGKVKKLGYFVFVTDAYSNAIIGWAVGKTETSVLVQKALRDALRTSGGVMGKWFNSDHGSANLSSEVKAMLKLLESRGLTSQPYNPQAKPVENVIGKFEQEVLRDYPNFAGGNRTAKKLDSFENTDVIKSLIKEGLMPDEDKGIEQFIQAIAVYNNSPSRSKKGGMSRMEKYKSIDSVGKVVGEMTLVDLTWVTRKDSITYTKNGLVMEVEGETHIYEVESEKGIEDAAFKRRYINRKLRVKYNPEALDYIHVYDGDVWIAKANNKMQFAKTPDEMEGEDRLIWEKRLANRAQETKDGLDFVADNRKRSEDIGLYQVDFQYLNKDVLNELEEVISTEPYKNIPVKYKQQKATTGIYSEEASLKVIE